MKTQRDAASLVPLFQPKHVAIVGASLTPDKHGNTVVRYLKRGFAGTISPIMCDGAMTCTGCR